MVGHFRLTIGPIMSFILQPWHVFFMFLAGWVNRQQHEIIAYLRTENQVLREKLGKKRILLSDDQRRRLAVKGKVLGRRLLGEIGTLFTPDTILRGIILFALLWWVTQLSGVSLQFTQQCGDLAVVQRLYPLVGPAFGFGVGGLDGSTDGAQAAGGVIEVDDGRDVGIPSGFANKCPRDAGYGRMLISGTTGITGCIPYHTPFVMKELDVAAPFGYIWGNSIG